MGEKEGSGAQAGYGVGRLECQGGGGTADRLYMIEGCLFYIFISRSMCILFREEFGKDIVEGRDKEGINLAMG